MERKILTFGDYFENFYKTLGEAEKIKVAYALLILKTQERISTKWVKYIGEGLYELRIEINGNIFRVFFIFENNNIVILFNGFQKKDQKTPKKEIDKAKQIMKLYYESKQQNRTKQ